jgi:hypothetical protein
VVRTLHTLDAHIRRRLRALLLRQWKRRRFIVRRLIRMGARPNTAWRRTPDDADCDAKPLLDCFDEGHGCPPRVYAASKCFDPFTCYRERESTA